MENEILIKEFEEKFEKLKKEIGFSTQLEELDKEFFIKDAVAKDKFLSQKLSRQICYRIVEAFVSWNDYLHSLIMPNPQNMLNMSESKIFSQEEKKEMMGLMKMAMEISSRNGLIGLKHDKKMEAQFIDDSFDIWSKKFKPKVTKIMEKINKEWGKKE
jgi:hypothetical protein